MPAVQIDNVDDHEMSTIGFSQPPQTSGTQKAILIVLILIGGFKAPFQKSPSAGIVIPNGLEKTFFKRVHDSTHAILTKKKNLGFKTHQPLVFAKP